MTVSRGTIDRWIRAWRDGGFAALAPPARQVPRTDAEVLEMAAGLKRENPARTAAQVQRILVKACGWSPSVRTLQRHFERLELRTSPDGLPRRCSAGSSARRRTRCVSATPCTARASRAGRRTCSASSTITRGRWPPAGAASRTLRLAAALRPALAARGVPARIYTDNGSAFVDASLKRAAARLGM